MPGRVFTCLALISLALCVATLLWWGVAQRWTRTWITVFWNDSATKIDRKMWFRGWGSDGFFASEVTWSGVSTLEWTPEALADPTNTAFIRGEQAKNDARLDLARQWLRGFGPAGTARHFSTAQLPNLTALQGMPRALMWFSGDGYAFSWIAKWFAVTPVLWGIIAARGAWVTRKQRRAGQCERCGYDLRATPNRCPECGAPGGRRHRLPT